MTSNLSVGTSPDLELTAEPQAQALDGMSYEAMGELDKLNSDIQAQTQVDAFNEVSEQQGMKVEAKYNPDTNEIIFTAAGKKGATFTVSKDEGLEMIAGGAYVDKKFVEKAGSAQAKFEDGKYCEHKYDKKLEKALDKSDRKGDKVADEAVDDFNKVQKKDGEIEASYDDESNQFTFTVMDSGVSMTVGRTEGLHMIAQDDSGESPVTAETITSAVTSSEAVEEAEATDATDATDGSTPAPETAPESVTDGAPETVVDSAPEASAPDNVESAPESTDPAGETTEAPLESGDPAPEQVTDSEVPSTDVPGSEVPSSEVPGNDDALNAVNEFNATQEANGGTIEAKYNAESGEFTFTDTALNVSQTVGLEEGLQWLAGDASGDAPITSGKLAAAAAEEFILQQPLVVGPEAWANVPGSDNPVESLVYSDYNTDGNRGWGPQELGEALADGVVVFANGQIQVAEGAVAEYQGYIDQANGFLEGTSDGRVGPNDWTVGVERGGDAEAILTFIGYNTDGNAGWDAEELALALKDGAVEIVTLRDGTSRIHPMDYAATPQVEEAVATEETAEAEETVVAEETTEAEETVAAEEATEAEETVVADETSEAEEVAEEVVVADDTAETEDVVVAEETTETEETVVAEAPTETEEAVASEELVVAEPEVIIDLPFEDAADEPLVGEGAVESEVVAETEEKDEAGVIIDLPFGEDVEESVAAEEVAVPAVVADGDEANDAPVLEDVVASAECEKEAVIPHSGDMIDQAMKQSVQA